jgi:hypothetical protein
MSPDEIVTQFQQIVATLKRTIEASAELAERVAVLEQQTGEKLGLLTSLQGHLKVLLETYQAQTEAQHATNLSLAESVRLLGARIAALEKVN